MGLWFCIFVTKEPHTSIRCISAPLSLRSKGKAKKRAEMRLDSKQDDVDVKRAEIALKRAVNRLDISQRKF